MDVSNSELRSLRVESKNLSLSSAENYQEPNLAKIFKVISGCCSAASTPDAERLPGCCRALQIQGA